jgi:uncharacterized DUF497 family protein
MVILPNPEKERRNRHKHDLGLALLRELLAQPHIVTPDDRSLGYEHESRIRITGRIGTRVFVLVAEPVEIDTCQLGLRPISFRGAERSEQRRYWQEVME